jgi:CubicO group peptidase (beta-lactamase class C family)
MHALTQSKRTCELRATAIAAMFCFTALATIAATTPVDAAYTIIGGPGPAPANANTPNADYAQFDSIMTQFMLKANVPNAQLALGYGDRIVFSRAYTASTTERPLRVNVAPIVQPSPAVFYNESPYVTATTNTRFRVASLSKLVTGLALQQLVLDGKVSMTESAYAILREDTSSAGIAAFQGAPTDARMLATQVKHLVNHEAGFDRNSRIFSTATCTTWPSPTPCQGHPANQPRDIVEVSDPTGSVKPFPYPYTGAPGGEWVKTCKRHLEVDLPRRILHYAPGSPPQVSGSYYQFYTNIAYCWAERVIEIRSGMSYEDYVRAKVLRQLGIVNAYLALGDNRDRLSGEINEYYDQPGSTLFYAWCDIYDRAPYSPCVVPRPSSFRQRDYGGAGGWVFTAEEYLRMVQSANGRMRAPHLLDFPASNASGSDSLYSGPLISSGPSGAYNYQYRYSFGAGVTEWRLTATNALAGYYVSHTGSLPGTRSVYAADNATPFVWTITMNTSPDWDFGACSSATTVPDSTKYWCLLNSANVSENNGATITNANASNSIFYQTRAIHGDTAKRAVVAAAADLWVNQAPPPCNLDVNGVGNGARNGVADGLMILRAMQGGRGVVVTSNAIGTTSSATTTFDRAEKNARDLVTTKIVDIDGDGVVDPARDGAILLRAMLGVRDGALIAGLALTGPRNDWNSIRNYLNSTCAAGF